MEVEPKVKAKKRGKKYFPGKYNQESLEKAKARGRKYIPHGYGCQIPWVPHPEALVPQYTE